MDRDAATVVAALDEARAASGLPAGDFAVALGTSPSRFSTYRTGRTKPTAQFLVRAQRIGQALASARSRRLMSSLDTAAAIAAAADTDSVWRMLLQGRDHLRLMLHDSDGSAASWEPAPGSTGRTEWNALLAALAGQEFRADGEAPPGWCAASRPLLAAWVSDHPFLSADEVIAATPDFLKDLNIFVPARDLVTA